MVKTIKKLANTAETQELLAYHNTNDNRTFYRPGDTIVFDRFQLHSASCQYNGKFAVTVLTRKKHAYS
jgi:hypothetical protein